MIMASMGIDNIVAFVTASALVILAPGPANMYIASQTCRSTRQGMVGLAGIISGDIFLIFLSGVGFSALLVEWPSLLWAIKLIGASYIGWIGLKILRAGPLAVTGVETEVVFSGDGYRRGLLLTAMNPKAILFFGAFFPLFVSEASHSRWGSFMVLGTIFQIINLIYYGSLIFVVAHFKQSRVLNGWGKLIVTKLSGYGLLLCAAFIFIESTN